MQNQCEGGHDRGIRRIRLYTEPVVVERLLQELPSLRLFAPGPLRQVDHLHERIAGPPIQGGHLCALSQHRRREAPQHEPEQHHCSQQSEHDGAKRGPSIGARALLQLHTYPMASRRMIALSM